MAQTFLSLDYAVDVIDWNNSSFAPKTRYDVFVDIHTNMERIAPLLGNGCLKILHVTGAHWLVQNRAEYNRLFDLQKRRNITLKPRRIALPSCGIELADCATILGYENSFAVSTFRYAQKPVFPIPISTPVTYRFPERKDFSISRNRFLWLGGGGMVHKGLDLILEAFSQMPDCHLTVCGPVSNEPDFESAFHQELYETPNIRTLGWVDTRSEQFRQIIETTAAVIYPSCSEGQAGSIVTCMHAGLIPVVSRESGLAVDHLGFVLNTCSVAEIQEAVSRITSLSSGALQALSRETWELAQAHHTRQRFEEIYREIIGRLLTEHAQQRSR